MRIVDKTSIEPTNITGSKKKSNTENNIGLLWIAPTMYKKGHCIEPRKYSYKEYNARSHSNRYLQNQLKYVLFLFRFRCGSDQRYMSAS